MKRMILLFILCVLLLMTLVSCGGNGTAQTEPRVKGEAVDSDVIMNRQIGMVVTSITTADEYVADAEVRKQNDGVSVKAYEDGTTTLTAYDWWGNTATIEVVVEGSQITATNVTPLSGNVANVLFFGAKADDEKDDTANVQKAIDSLKGKGGTVYFPAGRYIANNIVIHDGITVRLQGKVDDVKAGYTDAVKAQVDAGEFAIWATTPGQSAFRNFGTKEKAKTGASNITVSGGMIDFCGRFANGANQQIDTELIGVGANKVSNTGGCMLACGDNILVENVIFKDGYNNHAFQMSGVSNVTIKNCMFAGFMARMKDDGNLQASRETIQIEQGMTGVFGESGDVHFSAGECYYSTNVKIQDNYFGKSDTSLYQMTPIGHHTAYGTASVTGLDITGNVFDNPYYCAMRFPNYCDITIKNNKFISNTKGLNTGALIDMFYDTNQRTYSGVTQSGSKATVILAFGDTHDGIHGVAIENNEFEISGNSNKRLISINGYIYNYGARTVRNQMMKVKDQVYGKSYTGFVKVSNTISDVTVKNNKINISASGYFNDYMINLSRISNLEVANNEITLSNGVSFTNSYGSQAGIRVANEINAKESNKLTFEIALSANYVCLPDGNGGMIKIASNSTAARKLLVYGVEGLKLDVSIDASGNAVVSVICEDGKTFGGWTVTSGSCALSGTVKLTGDVTLTAKLK